jgi:uncharacterized damage-inducible protein DinB
MVPAVHALIAELDAEAPATRRVLERLPADRFDWRPHPKSMTVAQLAHHVATIPATVARFAGLDGFEAPVDTPSTRRPRAERALLETFDASIAALRDVLGRLDETSAGRTFRVTAGGREIFAIPRTSMVRTMGLNHWYHHRGELVVYLRLLDVPVPVVYGRSADENPFGTSATR